MPITTDDGKKQLVVASRKDQVLLYFTLWQSFFTTGIIFGWPALLLMLTREGIYASECASGESECKDRTLRFNMVFTVGASVSQAAGIFVGFVVDLLGPRRSMLIGASFIVSASCMFAFSDDQMDLFPFAYALYAAGGGLVHLPSFSLSNQFGEKKAMVLSSFVGIFSLSGLMFSMFGLLNKAPIALTRAQLFCAHAVLVAINAIVTAWLWPDKAFQAGGSNKSSESLNDEKELASKESRMLEQGEGNGGGEGGGVSAGGGDISGSGSGGNSDSGDSNSSGASDKPGLWDVLQSVEYLSVTLGFSVALLMVRMYQGTCYDQLGLQVSGCAGCADCADYTLAAVLAR
jgi:MFS family permease